MIRISTGSTSVREYPETRPIAPPTMYASTVAMSA